MDISSSTMKRWWWFVLLYSFSALSVKSDALIQMRKHHSRRQHCDGQLSFIATQYPCRAHHIISHRRVINMQSSNNDEDYVVDRGLRFSGIARLYSNKDTSITTDTVLTRLSSATVAVVGIGGVGSWAAESLCRSGIGNLILIDLDDICISNTNRQLHATSSNVGKMKIDVMKDRLLDINPMCNVTCIHDFVTVDNAETLLQSMLQEFQLTACIDAIDDTREKTSLILACVKHGIPIVTCGGAAGRSDPTKIVIDDLTKVQEDRLLFSCRKKLRQQYGFPKIDMPKKGKKNRIRSWRISAVYSLEVQEKPPLQRLEGKGQDTTSSFRICDGALGTACSITVTYGMVAASRVVEMIALDKLIVPKKQGKKHDIGIQ